MKRSCKNIDITDWQVVHTWVAECLINHKKRYDFRKLICNTLGLTKFDYKQRVIRNNEEMLLWEAAVIIAKDACQRIKDRDLKLSPVTYTLRIDPSSAKERLIGNESPMQQVFDYIAVCSCEDIWRRRIVKQQISGIRNRGALYGTRMIQDWIITDNRAANYANKHHYRYTRKCTYFVKCDVKQCYPSMRVENFMRLFRRDCANTDILWLWETLLTSHKSKEYNYEGFMIGAWCSQWACQYVLSFIYRHVMDFKVIRKTRKSKAVSHMLLQMDDLLLIGSNRKHLKLAVDDLVKFADAELGLTIKDNWQICKLSETPIDIVGYKIHTDGSITLRDQIFVRSRRMLLRAKRNYGDISIKQAKRIASYEGYYKDNGKERISKGKHADCRYINSKYSTKEIFDVANNLISEEAKKYAF